MKYYIKSNGKTFGPIEENKIKDRLYSGFFSYDSQVSVDLKEWLPLKQCIPIPQPASAETVSETDHDVMIDDNDAPSLQLTEDYAVHPAADIPEKKRFHFNKKTVIVITACILAALCIGSLFVLTRFFPAKTISATPGGTPAPVDFQQVCKLYQSAVGVVIVTLEDSNGKLLSAIGDLKVSSDYPIGTAFAIDKDKFATNCHVAYGVKDRKTGALEEVLWRIVFAHAQDNGVKTREEFLQYYKKNEKNIEEVRKYLHAHVRVRNVEIRLAHSGGRSLNVTGVQIHPRYQTDPDKNSEFKNGEFDLAILTAGETVDCFFKIAPKKKLYSLAPGQAIAYLGFPMEGLQDRGNLDLNRPEAIFKSGTINKITDFNNVFSMPEFNKSIIHDIPAAGGASGSPIFLPDGDVVAILWGVTHSGKNRQGRIASATQHNMAVRIDSLETVKNQKIYSMKEWLGEDKK